MADIMTPALGESVTEATVARWTKKAGDAVRKDEILVELETDKVSLEVAAPADDWHTLLARHLSGHAWASYHDVISTAARPKPGGEPAIITNDQDLETTLVRFWPGGTIELNDHETFRLAGDRPHHYAVWQIARRRWHLVEWADNAGPPPDQAQTST